MRLNRGTLILVAAALIVIVGVLVLNSQQAAAPGDPTPAATVAGAGPILETVTAAAITAVQVRDNATGAYTALARNPAGEWVIAATNRTDRAVDQARVLEAISNAAELTSVDRFDSADLASFGLDTPQFTLYVETADGAFYVHVGDQNAFNRTYLAVQSADVTPFAVEVTAEPEAATTETAPEATPEAAATVEVTPEVTVEPTPEVGAVTLTGTQTVYTIIAASIDTLTQLVAAPPYVPAPTATPTGTNTPNPFSEVDMTATAQAVFDQLVQTATAAAQPPAVTAEVTPDATAEAAAEVTPDATAEATAEVTPDATAEATLEPTARPTGRVVIPTREVTAIPTREATTAPTLTATPTLTPTVTPTLEPTARPTGRVIIPTREATTAP